METAILASAFALAATAAATIGIYPPYVGCISQSDADTFITRFSGVLNGQGSDLGSLTETANALVADDFQEISNSILELEGLPLGGVTSPSKATSVGGISHAPPTNGVNTIYTLDAGCHKIVWSYIFTGVGSGKYPVKGFNLFEMTPSGQVTRLYVEFDSVAWDLDTVRMRSGLDVMQ